MGFSPGGDQKGSLGRLLPGRGAGRPVEGGTAGLPVEAVGARVAVGGGWGAVVVSAAVWTGPATVGSGGGMAVTGAVVTTRLMKRPSTTSPIMHPMAKNTSPTA